MTGILARSRAAGRPLAVAAALECLKHNRFTGAEIRAHLDAAMLAAEAAVPTARP